MTNRTTMTSGGLVIASMQPLDSAAITAVTVRIGTGPEGSLLHLDAIDAIQVSRAHWTILLSNGDSVQLPCGREYSLQQGVQRFFVPEVQPVVLAVADALKILVNPAALIGIRRSEGCTNLHLRSRTLQLGSGADEAFERAVRALYGEDAATGFAKPKLLEKPRPALLSIFKRPRVEDAEKRVHLQKLTDEARIAKAKAPITSTTPEVRNAQILDVLDHIDTNALPFTVLEFFQESEEWMPKAKAFKSDAAKLRKAVLCLLSSDTQSNLQSVSAIVAGLQRGLSEFPNGRGIQELREVWSVQLSRLAQLQPTDASKR